jgi:hypothetical protein
MSATIVAPVAEGYGSLVERFFATDYGLTPATSQATFEAISGLILGTKQYRYGPLPSPEVQTSIRSVIRDAMSTEYPIPVLIPWGASKQDSRFTVDIAELSALHTLSCIDSHVRRLYSPGLYIVFRLEAFGDVYLFNHDQYRYSQVNDYVSRFTGLARTLLTNAKVVTEGDYTDYTTFYTTAEDIRPHLEDYLIASDHMPDVAYPLPLALVSRGWKGHIGPDARSYYLGAYDSLYPADSLESKYRRLARYFAAAFARRKLNAAGELAHNSAPLEIGFHHPIPGSNFPRRISYRTIPRKYTHEHRSPWNSRGYVSIAEDGSVTPRLASWNASEVDLSDMTVSIGGVPVESPYHLED